MDTSKEIILEENMNEKEFSETKNYKKIKYSIAIIASILIIASVIALSICHFKVEVIKQETKPVVRNLGFDVTASRTFNLASFNIVGHIVSIKYVVSMTKTQCQNKVVISTRLGSFEFGNTGMSSPGQGSKSYMTKITEFTLPEFYKNTLEAYAYGSLSWDVSLKSDNKYNVGLTGTLSFRVVKNNRFMDSKTIEGKGTLAEAKGNLILSEGSITKNSDFFLGMGNLKINCVAYYSKQSYYDLVIYEGWRSIE